MVGSSQGVLQLLAALEQEKLPVVGEGPDNPAIAQEQVVHQGYCWISPVRASLKICKKGPGGAGRRRR